MTNSNEAIAETQSRFMNIKELHVRTEKGKIKSAKRAVVAARLAKAKELKLKRKEQAAFRSNLKWECSRITDLITEAADNGRYSISEDGWNDSKIVDAIKNHFQPQGFTVSSDSIYVEADNGDPDSGEGRCDAHHRYSLHISWKQN